MARSSNSQARGSAALRAAVLLLCVMLFTMDSFAAAASITVGGRAGWISNHNYGHMSVKRGDAVVFNYNSEAHNVVQVSQANYNKCVSSRPLKTYTSGRDAIKLTRPGTYYFICGVPGHCNAGMKVAVSVS